MKAANEILVTMRLRTIAMIFLAGVSFGAAVAQTVDAWLVTHMVR